MGNSILVSPGKIDTDSAMSMAFWLLMTAATASSYVMERPNYNQVMKYQKNKIVLDMVQPRYTFGYGNDAQYHPLWFADETDEVCIFDTGRQGHGKVKVYDHHFLVPVNNFKKPKSATRMVWEEFKDKVHFDPITYKLLADIVDWVDELDSKEINREQGVKEVLYDELALMAKHKAGHRGVKIHTNHINHISYLPKSIGKEARNLKGAKSVEDRVRVVDSILHIVFDAVSDYLRRGRKYMADEQADWKSLETRMTVFKLNSLVDLVVVKNSSLRNHELRYRLNQRYGADPLKPKYYVLLVTFEDSQNLRVYKSFPQALVDLNLWEMRNQFMKKYHITGRYTHVEADASALSLNGVAEQHPDILSEAEAYVKENFYMRIPEDQFLKTIDLVDKVFGFVASNVSMGQAEYNDSFLEEIQGLLERNYFADSMDSAKDG